MGSPIETEWLQHVVLHDLQIKGKTRSGVIVLKLQEVDCQS